MQRGLPAFLEVADAFLDEHPRVQSASRFIILDISRLHYGYNPSKAAWPSKDAEEEWSRVWRQPEMEGFDASTLDERQAVVKKWKQWYTDNVERKRKL